MTDPQAPATQDTVDERKPRLVVRQATLADMQAIRTLCAKVYPDVAPYSTAHLRGQMQHFAEGQFVAVFEGEVVGYCATFRIGEAEAFARHTWSEITGAGLASRHDPDGEWLYGMEVFVDPAYRGYRIGQRLYTQRKNLCQRLGLKGIVFGGRLPALHRRIKKVGSAEAYVEAVRERRMRDPVLSFQMRNGFEPIGVLPDYLPSDRESLGYAAHLVWRNPRYAGDSGAGRGAHARHSQRKVRVSIVQYQQRRVRSFEEFGHNVEYFVDVVADYRADFVVFPELFTLQLLSIENQRIPASEAIATLTRYTEPLKELLSRLAVSYNINIIGGSHPTLSESGQILNICYVCLRDGSVHQQVKIHPTPNERYWWNIEGGNSVDTIMTDCGPIGVMICYDSEFPELPRHLVDQGAQILFVPFCTDERQSYLRVRYCCQARAVENQCYVVMSGNVGNLPNVENMDIQYAQSCILTPCDMPFARDGVAADTTPNVEMVAFADLRMDDLTTARQSGTVQNLRDRRFDLYSVAWRSKG
jgi:predicted amidohydrolase/GNAT superfamily N-acetyltransferase